MRILAVCQNYWPEPFNTNEICEELARCGHEVTVLTGLPNYPEGEIPNEYKRGQHRDEIVNQVRVIRVPVVARGRDLHGFNKVRRVLNYLSFPLDSWLTGAASRGRYDCVISFQFSPIQMALPALRLARSQGIPCLVYVYDLWPEDLLTGGFDREGLAYRAMRNVSRTIYSRADKIAVTSPKFADYFRDELGLDGLDVTWLPQYAEDVFEGMSILPSAQRGDEVIFTFAGNIGGNQAVQTIVRASSLVKNPRVRVQIAGSGSRLEECRALASELGASNLVFLGRLPFEKMPGLYAESDAMLLTLARNTNGSLVPVYTIPRKFQSYIAAGKPVICSSDGSVAKIVEQEGCGIACGAEDAEGLATAMDRFAALTEDSRRGMGDRSRVLYQEQFSRSKFFERLEQILQDMTQGERDRL